MSLIKANAVQIGQSGTATQNFTLAVPSSPDGTIKLARGNSGATTQDVISVDASGNINGLVKSTGSTTARSLANRFADVLNVKDFGAVGDGVADDTAAIQATINAASTASNSWYSTLTGNIIFIPAGRYKVTSELLISSSFITIIGAGTYTTQIVSSNATGNIIRIQAPTLGVQLNTIQIEKLFIGRSVKGDANSVGFYIHRSAHVKIIDCESRESAKGFYATWTNNLKIQRCKVVLEDYVPLATDIAYGFYFEGTAAQPNASVETRDCEVIFITSGIVGYAGTAYGLYLTGNMIKDCFIDALETAGADYGIWIESTIGAGENYDIHILRNIHDSYTKEGIVIKDLQQYGSVSIVGGWVNPLVIGATNNIRIENSRSVTINGTTFFGGGNFATNVGVYLKNALSCAITGCAFKGQKNAIVLDGGGLNSISSNTMYNLAGQEADQFIKGINVTNRNTINLNTLDGYINNGIHLDATTTYNNVFGNNVNSTNANAIVNLSPTNLVTGIGYSSNLAKAWAYCTVAGTTPTLADGFNIASVSRQSIGVYRYTFINNLPNINYSVNINASAATTQAGNNNQTLTKTSSYFDIEHFENSVVADPAKLDVIVFSSSTV